MVSDPSLKSFIGPVERYIGMEYGVALPMAKKIGVEGEAAYFARGSGR